MNRQPHSFAFRFAATLVAIFAVLATPLRAEDASTPTVPLPTTFAPPPPPPPPQQDRKNGQGMAAAMAAVGAAIAGASCMMLMKQAREETDKSMKMLLQTQAMQQCSQAAQSAANAAKNDEGKKEISKNDTPAGNQMQVAPPPATAKAEENKATDFTVPSEETPEPEVASAEAGQPDLGVFDQKPAASDISIKDAGPGMTAEAESVSKLKPIDTAQVKFDDGAKGGEPTPDASLAGAGGSMSFASSKGNLSDDAMKKLAQETIDLEAAAKKARNKKGGEPAEGGEGASGGGSAASGGGNGGEGEPKGEDSFNSMLAQIMGGGGSPAAGGFMESQGGTVERPGTGGADAKIPNLFQYANYRYRTYAKETSMGVKKKPKTAVPPLRSIASVGQ